MSGKQARRRRREQDELELVEAGPAIRTLWRLIPAAVWNEHHLETVEAPWALHALSIEDGTQRLLASMAFPVDEELMALYPSMDDYIDEVAFPQLLDEVEKVRPLGDLVMNAPLARF